MKGVQKVADDLYLIEEPMRPGWFVGVTVVLGSRKIGLVDTGFERTPEERIFPALRDMERKIEEINYVVNTHRDGDHIQGNRVVKEKTGAKIAIHELEAEAVETADIKLRDGDIVELGDRKFRVVHTSGHRPGSICLYDEKNRTLVTGDSVCGDRTDLIRMDRGIYINSLRKLLELDIRILVMSHPFNPSGKAILVGGEPKEMLLASIGIAERMQ